MEKLVKQLLGWYDENKRDLPWRKSTDPYCVWVSEIMCQQTRIDTVIPYYLRFMDTLKTIKDLSEVDDDQLTFLWQGLGYYSRAFNLRKAAIQIQQQFNGIFPENYQDVLSLPGIGKYTAGAICSISFNQPIAAVDGNVVRVLSRYLALEIKDNEQSKQMLKEKLEAVYPKNRCGDFTQSLMELGALICIPNGQPKCDQCPLKESCKAHLLGKEIQYPLKKEKKPRKKQDWTVLFIYKGNDLLVQKREDSGLLANMYEPIVISGKLNCDEVQQYLLDKHIPYSSLKENKSAKHIFSHIEWDMISYRIEFEGKEDDYTWMKDDGLISLPTAFSKLLK